MNKVILIGNVGREPEMRYTPQGHAVTSFSVATSYGKGDDKTTEWFNCSAWGKQAELTNEYLRKGSQVYVEGRIRSREYEVDRKTRCSLDVSVSRVQFLGSARPTSKDVDEVLKPHASLIFEVDGCQSHWLLSLSRIVERSQIGQTMSHRTVLEVPVQGVGDVLHDDVGGAVFDLEVMGAGDVGAVKTSGQPGFALEGVQVLGVVRNGLIDDLNGDDTVQHGVAGTVDRTLAAGGYPVKDFVSA